jgi:hypothetical protein
MSARAESSAESACSDEECMSDGSSEIELASEGGEEEYVP